MAIIIEEEKKQASWVNIVIAAVMVVVLFVGAYFLFFKQPQLIEVVTPKQLQEINKISAVSFDPEMVVNSPIFKSLRQYGTPVIPPQTVGRANPFAPGQ